MGSQPFADGRGKLERATYSFYGAQLKRSLLRLQEIWRWSRRATCAKAKSSSTWLKGKGSLLSSGGAAVTHEESILESQDLGSNPASATSWQVALAQAVSLHEPLIPHRERERPLASTCLLGTRAVISH